jgi:hypothetical protein
MPLNGFKVVDGCLGIASAKSEGRHARVNGGQAVLQTLSKIVVVKLALSKRSKWRCIKMPAATRRANSVTISAETFKQVPSSLLLVIQRIAATAPGAQDQEREASFLHGKSFRGACSPRPIFAPQAYEPPGQSTVRPLP